MIREVRRGEISACAELIRKSFQTVADEFGFTRENAPRFTAFATTEERLIWQMESEHRLMYLDEVIRLMKTTYWANKRSKEQIRKSMDNSSCYGIYLISEQKLAGFARVISDFATTYYLADVVIDPDCRHRGLGKALVSHIVSLPEYAGLSGLLLTKDAHGLYEKYGFETADGRAMVKSPNHG